MRRLAHVTDPHWGRADLSALAALPAALRAADPDVVVFGGDLTHRSKRDQFHAVRAFLDDLPFPWIAVPGNHDVPLHNLFMRVVAPAHGFRRYVSDDPAPLYVGDGLRVLGLDSTRRKVTGRLKEERLEPIAQLSRGEPGDLRVLVTHHPLVRKPLEGAARALEVAAAAGVEVALAGHHHRQHVTAAGPVLCVETRSPSHLLEPVRGFTVVSATDTEITVQPWTWDGTAFAPRDPAHTRARNAGVRRL